MAPHTAYSAPKKEPIIEKIAEGVYLSKGDVESLNEKLNAWFLLAFAFLAREIYGAFKNKGKKIDDIYDAMIEIKKQLEHVPTKEEARQIAREEVDRGI